MEKKNCIETVQIEIEEPCLMDLVNPEEREQLRKRIIEKIRSDVANLFISEIERVLKERYNLSPENLVKRQVLSEPDLT
jgi:tRNA A37 N6-isopentenylltransferase MiaA